MEDTNNPRARMVQDVIKNQLKPGMSRKEVLDILGKPYQENTELVLPKNTIIPDSISSTNPEKYKPENIDRTVAAANKFYQLHGRSSVVMRYPVGWSTIDPNFLIVVLNNRGLVEQYVVVQG